MIDEFKNKAMIDNINTINPLWFFNHLPKEDKSYFLDHLDEIIAKSEKYGIKYEVAINAPISGINIPDDIADDAFTPVRSLTRAIEIKTKKNLNKFSTETMMDPLHIPIASDYIHMIDNLDPYDVKNTLPLIRGLAEYEFKGISDITDIIDAVASIIDGQKSISMGTIYDIIKISEVTIDMLISYVKSTSPSLIDFNYYIPLLKSSLTVLSDVEPYFSGNLDNGEDDSHVATFIMNLVGIYLICNPDISVSNDHDKLLKLVKRGSLYGRLRSFYYRSRDDLDSMLKDIVEIYLPSASISMAMKETIEKYNNLLIKSERIRDEIPTPETTNELNNPLLRLPIKDQVEIKRISSIEIDDIEDAICSKLGVTKGTISILPFNEIDEELLAMYLAEFNKLHPIMVFPDDPHYYISWDGLYYVLFELKTKTTHIGNCLYAIRISETGSTKMYDLIQFRKSDTVKYVFEY